MPGLQVVKAVMLVFGSVNAARVLQERLLACVVRLPMSFFDSQPTGRLLNRFTKDTGGLGVQTRVWGVLEGGWGQIQQIWLKPGVLSTAYHSCAHLARPPTYLHRPPGPSACMPQRQWMWLFRAASPLLSIAPLGEPTSPAP